MRAQETYWLQDIRFFPSFFSVFVRENYEGNVTVTVRDSKRHRAPLIRARFLEFLAENVGWFNFLSPLLTLIYPWLEKQKLEQSA